MAIEIARLFASVGIDTKNFDKGINGLKGKLGGLDKGLSGIMGGAGGIAALAGVGAVAALGSAQLEMAKTAAKSEELKQSFDDLASGVGQSGSQMLSSMRTASKGLVSDTDLVLAGNRAMLLGVADNSEEMGKLLEIARVRGRAMGLDLSTAFDNIVTGLGRMSPLILDNLGIVVNQEQANKAYAASLGKTASALSDAEKKQALLNAVIRDSEPLLAQAGDALTDAEKIQSMEASASNLGVAWGKMLLAMGVPEVYAAIADGMEDIAVKTEAANAVAGDSAITTALQREAEISRNRIHALTQELGKYGGWLDWLTKENLELERAELRKTVALIKANEAVEQVTEETMSLEEEMKLLKRSEREVADNSAEVEAALTAMGIKMGESGEQALTAAAKFKELKAVQDAIVSGSSSIGGGLARAAAGAVGSIGEDASNELLNQQLSILKQRTSEWRLNQVQGEELIFQQQVLADELNRPFELIEEARKATEKWANTVPTITEEFAEVESAVRSALQGAFNLSDIKGDEFKDLLPREDAVNEDARRLADIAVKGWESPWADYFQKERPDLYAEIFESDEDPKAKALAAMKQFEAGLRPELLNRDMLKDQIRDAILGQQAMEALVDEISKELSEELGIAMTEIKGAAGGITGGADTGLPLPITPNLDTAAVKDQLAIETPALGTTMGEGVETGMKDYIAEEELGAATSEQIAKQMNDNVGDFKTPGENAGEQWGLAFLERVGSNVPQQLIDMLINLITPGIQANFAGAESQTSAEGSPEGEF